VSSKGTDKDLSVKERLILFNYFHFSSFGVQRAPNFYFFFSFLQKKKKFLVFFIQPGGAIFLKNNAKGGKVRYSFWKALKFLAINVFPCFRLLYFIGTSHFLKNQKSSKVFFFFNVSRLLKKICCVGYFFFGLSNKFFPAFSRYFPFFSYPIRILSP